MELMVATVNISEKRLFYQTVLNKYIFGSMHDQFASKTRSMEAMNETMVAMHETLGILSEQVVELQKEVKHLKEERQK